MGAPRFSLALIGVFVAVCGVAFGALRANSPVWADATLNLTLGFLLFAVLAAVIRRRGARSFWLGFSLFGWAYVLLTFGPWFDSQLKPHLVTNRFLEAASLRVLQYPPGAFRHYDNVWTADPVTGKWSLVASNVGTTFERTGHCLIALLLGLAGGALGRLLFAAEMQSTTLPAQASASGSG
jgi:hypothetical protein